MKRNTMAILMLLSISMSAQTWTNYNSTDGLIEGIISNIIIDSEGTAWFVDWMDGDNPGVGNFDGSNWEQFPMGEGPSGNRFQGLLQDGDGDYWFGGFLDETGLDRFDGTNWTNFTTSDGLAGDNVSDILLGNNGNVWIACWDAVGSGVTAYDGNDFTSFLADGNVLPEVAVRRLDQTSNDDLWMATSGGVVFFDFIDYTLYASVDGLSADAFEVILVDDADEIWAGADIGSGGGLNHFDGSSWTIYTQADGLPDNSIRALFQDTDGNLWIGTNGGISRFNGIDFLNYTTDDGLIGNNVRAITQDGQGNLWIGTWDGISVLNPTLGIFDNQTIDLAIAPNPATDLVQISSDAPIKNVMVYDMLGKLLLEFDDDSISRISVASLSAGSYWVAVESDRGDKAIRQLLVK